MTINTDQTKNAAEFTENMQDYDALIKAVTELRDADSHVCPWASWQAKTLHRVGWATMFAPPEGVRCTCDDYDNVIDKLERLKSKLQYATHAHTHPPIPTYTPAELRARAVEWRREAEFFTLYELDEEAEKRCYANADQCDKEADRAEEMDAVNEMLTKEGRNQ